MLTGFVIGVLLAWQLLYLDDLTYERRRLDITTLSEPLPRIEATLERIEDILSLAVTSLNNKGESNHDGDGGL